MLRKDSRFLGRISAAWLPFAPLLILLPWFLVQLNTAVSADDAWLMIAAQRLLAGGHFVTDFYDANPPLSVLLYVPHVWLARIGGLPIYYMPCLIGGTALGLSGAAVWRLLRGWPALGHSGRAAFLGGSLLAGTFLSNSYFFAERDAFVVWGLLPFLLVQLSLVQGIALPRRLAWPVLAIGAVCILIKPHYLLLPCLLIAWRWLRRRRIGWRDADAVALVSATLLYAALLRLFFADYLAVVLPDLIHLYIPVHRWIAFRSGLESTELLVVLLCANRYIKTTPVTQRAIWLCGLATALCFFLFALQGKGVYYHLLPALAFLMCGCGLFIDGVLARRGMAQGRRIFVTLLILTAGSYVACPIRPDYLSHRAYAQLPLVRLARSAGDSNSIFIFSEGMEMVAQAGLYSGTTLATRFPDFWWLYGTLRGWDSPADGARFTGYAASDLHRYHPAILAIDATIYYGGTGYFDLVGYLSRYPDFRAEMAHYRRDGELDDNRRAYFMGTPAAFNHPMLYDLYRRLPDAGSATKVGATGKNP